MSGEISWIPLESNPEVMNKFLYKLGVPKNWAMVDVYGLDDVLLAIVPRPVLAVILLFPLTSQETSTEQSSNTESSINKNVFFMRQTVKNACGTVALIHSVCNNESALKLAPDTPLYQFINEAKNLTPAVRGKMLESNKEICNTHKLTASEGQTEVPDPNVNVDLHFVAFVHVDGHLYELDGRKTSPVDHGPTTADTLLQDSTVVFKEFMKRDPDNVNFTVMALAAAEN